MCNYIFLGDDERNFFAKTTHEYLIEQNQFNLFQGLKAGPNYIETTFSHPVKEIVWVLTRDDLYLSNNWYNFSEEKSTNAFAYFTEIFKRGLAKGYNQIYKKKGDNDHEIKLISIQNSNDGQGIHSI